jgi:hypothetical protein
LDDAVRARKALNGRDVLGSDVGAIRIGFAKVPTKGGVEGNPGQEEVAVNVQGIGEMSVGATIHALRGIKGASTIPVDQQVLSGSLENYRSNLLLSMIGSGMHTIAYASESAAKSGNWSPPMTEQQMIMRELSGGALDAEAEIEALAGEYASALHFQLLNVAIQISDLPLCTILPYRLSQRDLTTDAGMPPNFENSENGWTLAPFQWRRSTTSRLTSSTVKLLIWHQIGSATR